MSCPTDAHKDPTQNTSNLSNDNGAEITTDLLIHIPPLLIPPHTIRVTATTNYSLQIVFSIIRKI
eukprot:8929585-Ditylum_brightwellii.AAC.1